MTIFARLVVLRPDRSFLALRQRTARGPAWNLPGGKLEPGETPQQAAARETFEEAGLAFDPADLDPLARIEADFDGVVWTGHFFAAAWKGGIPTLREPDRFAEIAWLTLERARACADRTDVFSDVVALAVNRG